MNALRRIYPYLLIGPVILPLIIWSGLIYPYLVPKTLLFYALSLVSFAAFVVLAAYGEPFYFARLRAWEAWVPGALLAVAYIASIFGLDFYRSFWSLFIRGDGLLMLTCAVGTFYLVLLSSNGQFFTRLTRSAAAIGCFVALYGIVEWLTGGGRIGSLLGNAAFFAGYEAIALFATLFAARELRGAWRRAAYTGAVLEVIAIILTATRGTMLALLVAAFLYLVYLAFARTGKVRTYSSSIILGLIFIAGIFIAFRGPLSHSSFSPVARIASIGLSDPDIASRLFIWKNMTSELLKRPWLGAGAEHVDVLFNRFYDPSQIGEEWFDRSHNAFLDYAAQYGVAGFALYILLILSLVTTALRLRKQGEETLAISAILLAVVYAVQNFFVFDTVSSFWLLLALLGVLLARSLPSAAAVPARLPNFARFISWPVAAALLLLIIPVSITPWRAAADLARAYAYGIADVDKEISYLEQGYNLGTYGDIEYGYEAYDIYVNHQQGYLTGAPKSAAYGAAVSVLSSNFKRYPYDARTALYLAQLLSIAPAGQKPDPAFFSGAIERILRESPKRAQAWYLLANLSLTNANANSPGSAARTAGYAAAKDILERYIALVPTLSEPHFVLAELLYASGKTGEATVEAAKGKAYYRSGDLETARRAVGYYETVLDLPDAAFFLGEILHGEPDNAGAKADLEKIQAYEQSQK